MSALGPSTGPIVNRSSMLAPGPKQPFGGMSGDRRLSARFGVTFMHIRCLSGTASWDMFAKSGSDEGSFN